MALALASRAEGRTSPNPMVGAVVVRRGRVVGRGYHHRAGGPHAEVLALEQAGSAAAGATLILNLEPCCHYGKTPPCTDAIIQARVARVVAGMRDPNPRVDGGGFEALRAAGIEVEVGVLEEACKRFNEEYVHFITTGRPFVILKLAASLDGRIATAKGASKWITGERARRHVHRLRSRVDAVMVGAGTVRADDPSLTVRLDDSPARNPARVVVDSALGISPRAKVFSARAQARVIVATTPRASAKNERRVAATGATVVRVRARRGRVDLAALLARLAKLGITSVLVEGGSELATALWRAQLVDKLMLFLAPCILGGDAVPAFGALEIPTLAQAVRLERAHVHRLDDDVLIEAFPAARRPARARPPRRKGSH